MKKMVVQPILALYQLSDQDSLIQSTGHPLEFGFNTAVKKCTVCLLNKRLQSNLYTEG